MASESVTINRKLSLEEMVERSGLSRAFFYCNRSDGRLMPPLERIGGRIFCTEDDFQRWQRAYTSMALRKPGMVIDELRGIVQGVAAAGTISPEAFPEVFKSLADCLQGSFGEVVEVLMMSEGIPLSERMERYRAFVSRIEAGFMEGLSAAARAAFFSTFLECSREGSDALWSYVRSEYQKGIRASICSMLVSIRQSGRTGDEIEQALASIDESLWDASGLTVEERSLMVSEVHEGITFEREVSL